MGVPALFRWLSAKYPKIVETVKEGPPQIDEASGEAIPLDLLEANPNGVEFDNLYLDMNGIIHPCCHPMDKAAPATEGEMMVEIFKYIDRIFAMIRPRKLLFMAIDGVAPRAKMNQQRSRRFRAARERREKAEKALQLREDARSTISAAGEEEDEQGEGNDSFDSNCITPGTRFMALVASSVRYYVTERMSRDPAWQKLKVIFSDASVPGEGEHKIVDYIRRQRLDPDYDPNTKHVIYGLDADLIMLSMATHEPHFRVLREDVFWEEQVKYNPCTYCGVKGHAADCCPERRKKDPDFQPRNLLGKPFIFLDVAILREYLEAEMRPANPGSIPFKWDLERAIDDWIFMCFFVGNDFLPHLPSMEIREGAVDLLIDIYKNNAHRLGGYICHNGEVNLKRAEIILVEVARVEEQIFRKRREKEERKNENIRKRSQRDAEREELLAAQQSLLPKAVAVNDASAGSGPFQDGRDILQQRREVNMAAAQALKAQLFGGTTTKREDTSTATESNAALGKKHAATIDSGEPLDDVRLWESGAKERYYRNKFHVEIDNFKFIQNIARSYVEGLCWVMAYYYQGCPSWKWFYPYHFAPMASDLREIEYLFKKTSNSVAEGNTSSSYVDADKEEAKVIFERGEPFRPFDQLMGVFPADSRNLVPEPFRRLMVDVDSEILEFYPEDFAIDLNGKKQAWQGVVLLPFIEEKKLLNALDKVYPELSEEDRIMNIRGGDRVFFSCAHPGFPVLSVLLHGRSQFIPLDPAISDGLAGYVSLDDAFPPPGSSFPSPIPALSPDTQNIQVTCYFYHVPYYERIALKHKSTLLPGTRLPEAVLTIEDVQLITSGTASRRVPGRLHISHPSAAGPAPQYGHHSMHQEYSRNYEVRDSGNRGTHYNRGGGRRDYVSPDRSQGRGRGDYDRNGNRRDYSPDRRHHGYAHQGSGHAPPPQYPPPAQAYDRTQNGNPFNVLGHRPSHQAPMQPVMRNFHHSPPSAAANSGVYPPPFQGHPVGPGGTIGVYPPPPSHPMTLGEYYQSPISTSSTASGPPRDGPDHGRYDQQDYNRQYRKHQ